LFAAWHGSTRSPNALTKEWALAMSKAGLPITLHSLRHTHALIASGLDVLTISRRLGHGSPANTDFGQPMPWRKRSVGWTENKPWRRGANSGANYGANYRNSRKESRAKYLYLLCGRVAEWFEAAVLKTANGSRLT
jgi:hypothetical protein